MLEAGTIAMSAGRSARRELAASIRRTFPDHVPLYACAAVFCAIAAAAVTIFRLPVPLDAATFFLEIVGDFLLLGTCLAALAQLLVLFREGTDGRLLPILGRRLLARSMAGDRPGNAVHAVLALTPLMICFASMKSAIPKIQPFSWDPTLTQWDRAIGFGRLPWEWLQPELGYPLITAGLNAVYDSWFLIMFGSLFWQAFSNERSRTRMQYLVAFAFSWFIAGNVLAAIFSSAGPCFYGYLSAAHNPYGAQMAYLHEVNDRWPIWSVEIQDLLWQSYVTGSGAVSGISAMPSMHVASTVLIAILCTRVHRLAGIAAWIYTALIVLGSIHLAWHYAVDSIAGIGLAVLFWYAAGLLLRLGDSWAAHRATRSPAPA